MVKRMYFDHQGPGGPSLQARLARVHFSGLAAGEDIGYQQDSPSANARQMVNAWMNSPPHRANILRRLFRAAGIGIVGKTPESPPQAGSTFTVDFGS
jgi:uncharacterized protein YkwD